MSATVQGTFITAIKKADSLQQARLNALGMQVNEIHQNTDKQAGDLKAITARGMVPVSPGT